MAEDQDKLFPIPSYEDDYCATRDGRIYSLKTLRYLKKGDDTYGYDTVNLSGKTHKVHRIMARTFLSNPDDLPHIDHIDRNRKNNHIDNLKYVTTSENNRNRRKANKDPEMKYIQIKTSAFKVSMNSKNGRVYKSFKTLEEAKAFRDKAVNELKIQESTNAL